MESQESPRLAAPAPTQPVESGADASQIAEAIVSTWQQIEAALGPVIGQGGVAALYKRSLHLTGPAYPWLVGAYENVQTPVGLAALKSVLAQQSGATAAAGARALLRTFRELLASLVGPALGQQLLGAAWASPSLDHPAEDTSP